MFGGCLFLGQLDFKAVMKKGGSSKALNCFNFLSQLLNAAKKICLQNLLKFTENGFGYRALFEIEKLNSSNKICKNQC